MKETAVHGEILPEMHYADLHIHGEVDDGRLGYERIVREAQRARLTTVGVTAHDKYSFGSGFYDYVEQRPELGLTVRPGSEVTALGNDGKDAHILAFETEGDIRPYQSIPATLEEIYRRGGWAVIPHPDSTVGGSARFAEILDIGIAVPIEVFNAMEHQKTMLKQPLKLLGKNVVDSNKTTLKLYLHHQHQLGGMAGSTDAHRFQLGMGATAYLGDDVRVALERKETVPVRRTGLGGFEMWYPRDFKIHDQKVRDLDEWRGMKYNRAESLTQLYEEELEEAA